MGTVYLAWGLYIGVLAAHLLYWKVVPPSLALRRMGAPPDLTAQAFGLVVLTQLSLFAWPFVAAEQLSAMGEPHILSVVLMALACGVAALLLAAAAGTMWAIWSAQSPAPDHELRYLGTVVTVISLVGTVVVYWYVLSSHPYYG